MSYADVLESYLIPAEEGFGLDLLKVLGKGAGKIAKAIAIYLGINLAFAGAIIVPAVINGKKIKQRFDNPTPEEKISRDNFFNTWKPEIEKFKKSVKQDIEEADKKLDIKKFINIANENNDSRLYMDGLPIYYYYNNYLCGLDWEKCQYPDAAGDDAGDPELIKEFSEKIIKMKPYFDKWKNEAKKFAPYFELVLEVEEPDKDYYFCDFNVVLKCKWTDKFGILKPGLPEFNK